MTFGAHRGAEQGAGRSTSGRDLLHLLGGSTSALPPSIAGLLQLTGLTSTRPGQHTAFPDLHRHLRAGTRLPRAGIYVSRPAYMCPGRHVWARGQLRHFPAGIYLFLAGIYVYGLTHIDFGPLWPEFSGSGPEQQNPG
jgi:hypothetical protein